MVVTAVSVRHLHKNTDSHNCSNREQVGLSDLTESSSITFAFLREQQNKAIQTILKATAQPVHYHRKDMNDAVYSG